MLLNTVVSLIAVAATLAVGRPAFALSCAENVRPGPNEQHVPRNTRVWIDGVGSWANLEAYRWVDSAGVPVPFTVTRVAKNEAFLAVLTPLAPLAFPETYQVQVCEQSSPRCLTLTSFTTEDIIDTEPPPKPGTEPRGQYTDVDKEWGDTRIVAFDVPAGLIYVADVDQEGRDSPFTPYARISDVSHHTSLSIGTAPCAGTTFSSESADIRLGAFDLAGNFSGYTELFRVEKPPLASDGCSVAGTQHGDGMLLILIGMALSWGRRRSRLP